VTLGVPQDVTEFKRLFQSDWFDVVGISVSTDRHLDTLANLLPQLKAGADNLSLRLFVGGPMALREPARLKGIAAEVVAEDAPAAVTRVTQGMPLMTSSAYRKVPDVHADKFNMQGHELEPRI
jgi:MerR family transcriptional regulator, light-induced transcriptional regulator